MHAQKMHCCNDINNEHSFMSHTVQQQETDRENSLNVFLFYISRPQEELESAVAQCFRNPSCVVKHQLSQRVSSVHVVMDGVCVRAYVGGPPKSLLVFHDILQTPCLWFYTSKTHRELFLSQTYNLTVLLFFFFIPHFLQFYSSCSVIVCVLLWNEWDDLTE